MRSNAASGSVGSKPASTPSGYIEDRREFAGFYPYDIPGAHPSEDLVNAFPEKVRELRETLAATPPAAIGVLVNL